MKISQSGSGTPVNRSRKIAKSPDQDSESFKAHLESEPTSTTAAAAAATPLTALSTLLTIQESPDPMASQRRALSQGSKLLDELTTLQIGLVQGSIAETTLRRLSSLLNQPRPNLDDPELNDLLDEIEVRAAVELAKLEDRIEDQKSGSAGMQPF